MADVVGESAPQRRLTLLDSTCLITGIIVGAGVYQVAPDVASGATAWWGVLGLWVVGGLVSLCGALGYAELGAAYPRQGGDYVYLSRAYGGWAGFLFGWLQLAVVRPGDIVVMALAFATYARAIYDPLAGSAYPYTQQAYAAGAVAALTAINILGVQQGKWTQNALTAIKALGLLGIVALAVAAPAAATTAPPIEPMPLSVALILVLFSYGGWNEMAYVAAELKHPERNILRGMVLGIAAVTLLYVLLNGAFLFSLGHGGMAASEAVAVDAIGGALPAAGERFISALVCLSALGAVNGLVFTGARISYAVGRDHPLFARLGAWTPRTGTPAPALVLQAALALVLIVLLRDFVETLLYTSPAVYTFYLATTLAVIVLRRREPHAARPYRVTGYPATTLLFAAVCGYLIYSGVSFAMYVKGKPWIVLVPFAIMAAGLPLYWLSNRLRREPAPPV